MKIIGVDYENDKIVNVQVTTDGENRIVLAPVVHGHWVSDCNLIKGFDHIKEGDSVRLNGDRSPICSCHCSVCGEWLVGSDEYAVIGRFCPNCGAKMMR